MLNRRQRLLLDLLVECHRLHHHPSPARLSVLICERIGWASGTSAKTVRLELMRILDAGYIREVVPGIGSAPTRYKLVECSCPDCA